MSINEATPQDWDRLRKQHPAIDESLMSVYVEMTQEELDAYIFAEEEEDVDVVNKPRHYNTGTIECIEAIEESMSSVAFKGYLKGNCMKYLWRYDYKGKQVEDLEKAGWYLRRLTAMVTEENS
jgi:hypothetical protein